MAIAEHFSSEIHMASMQNKLCMLGGVSNEVSGGKLWLFWDKGINVSLVGLNNQSISILAKVGSEQIYVTCVYAKCQQGDRRTLWADLLGVNASSAPWIVMGGL